MSVTMIYLDSFLLKSNKDNEPKRASVAKATVLIKLSTEVKPVLGNSLALESLKVLVYELRFVL